MGGLSRKPGGLELRVVVWCWLPRCAFAGLFGHPKVWGKEGRQEWKTSYPWRGPPGGKEAGAAAEQLSMGTLPPLPETPLQLP